MTEPGTYGGSHDVHILILAAGGSSRLGSPKQLARVQGRPALQRVTATAVAIASQNVSVVVGAHAAEVMPMLARMGVGTVINPRWEEGLASSIRAGIKALPPACDSVMLLLGDQVAVTPDDLRRLLEAWKGQETVIAAALYQRASGVPAIFPRWCFEELTHLRGDRGAKFVLQRHAGRVVHVPMPNAAIDIDTPADLERLNTVTGWDAEAPKGPDFGAETWTLPNDLALEPDEPEHHASHHRPD